MILGLFAKSLCRLIFFQAFSFAVTKCPFLSHTNNPQTNRVLLFFAAAFSGGAFCPVISLYYLSFFVFFFSRLVLSFVVFFIFPIASMFLGAHEVFAPLDLFYRWSLLSRAFCIHFFFALFRLMDFFFFLPPFLLFCCVSIPSPVDFSLPLMSVAFLFLF